MQYELPGGDHTPPPLPPPPMNDGRSVAGRGALGIASGFLLQDELTDLLRGLAVGVRGEWLASSTGRKDAVDRRQGGLRPSRLGERTAISGQFCRGVAHTGGKGLGP